MIISAYIIYNTSTETEIANKISHDGF